MGCLTHTSVIEGPESRAADPALEGAEGVDADAFGTGSGISALVYICSTRRADGREREKQSRAGISGGAKTTFKRDLDF